MLSFPSAAIRFPFFLFLSAVACITAVCFAQSKDSAAESNPRVVVKNQGFLPFADAPINYRSENLDDPIARLQKRLDSGETVLRFDAKRGYLKSVLDGLRVPVSSQALVFSKTSFQFPEITAQTPRALYYNDDVYVGRVHSGKFLEFVSFDPMQGAVFYVLDEHQAEHPKFERAEVDCIQCHVAASTHNVPGVLMRSVFTRSSGYPAAGTHSFVTGHESPMSQRWGGWYVTAARGAEAGMANVLVSDPKNPEQIDRAAGANLTSLAGHFKNSDYLTGTSDVVALMVLAHQTQMHNLITLTNYQTRFALSPDGQISDAARKKFEDAAEQLVRYLLFTNEAPLASPVAGTSGFAEEFAARGPRDSRGRSLRDFDLRTRIFKYPCSYLVYSEDFDAIPEPAKGYIYRRLFEVLSGRDQSSEFASLKSEDRQAILEILVATKSGLPAEWKQFVQQTSTNSIRASAGVANR
jgi:hypothetical protein